MILLDTNIFIEYLLDQEHAGDCGGLLTLLSEGKVEGVVTRFSLHSIEVIYKNPLLGGFLEGIDRSLGLSVHDTTTAEESEVARLSARSGMDYDDAMQYFAAKKLGADAIVSFDRHFDGLEVKRGEPGDYLPAKR